MTTVKIRKTPRLRSLLRKLPFYEEAYLTFKRRSAGHLWQKTAKDIQSLVDQGCPIHRVEIETINRCDLDCPFCPARRSNNDRRPLRIMTDELFLKIMAELRDMDYDKALFIHCQNEPFMDHDIERRAQMAKQMVPKAWLVTYTDGNMMTPARYHKIMKWLDFLLIDNYNDSQKINPPIMKVLKEMTPEESKKTVVVMRYYNEILDWIGDGNNRKKWQTLDLGCTNPFCEIYIQPDGRVPMCCKDVFGSRIMGDVSKSTIQEVWHGEEFQTVRKALLDCNRYGFPICEKCDFIRKDPDEPMMLPTFKVKEEVI